MTKALRAPMSHGDYLAVRRFSVLDGLRAVSILLVFTAHPASQEFWPLIHGATGVTIFFVLSGFLITTLLLREERKNGAINLRAFYIRRTFRIYPVFFAALAFYCLLILVFGIQPERKDAFIENIPYFIFLFPEHSIFFNDNIFSIPFNGSWSIGIEEKFYLAWPVLGFMILRKWPSARLPLLLGLACMLFLTNFVGKEWAPLAPYQHIVYGAIIAVTLDKFQGYKVLSNAARPAVLAATATTAIVIQFGSGAALPGQSLYGVYGIVISLVLAGLVATPAKFTNWLSSRPMVRLGAFSYVIYLGHNFVINAFESLIPEAWGFPGSLLSTMLAFAATIFAAHFVHEYFEEPLRRFGVKLSKRNEPRSNTPPLADSATSTIEVSGNQTPVNERTGGG